MKNLPSFKTAKLMYKYGSLAFKASMFFQATIFRRSFKKNNFTNPGWHKKLAIENLELSEQMRKVEWSSQNRCKLLKSDTELIQEDIYPLA